MNPLLPLQRAEVLHDLSATRRLEARALAARPDLMEDAGLAVAKLALALWPGHGTVWVACGPGNNGGDGRVAARLLTAHGLPVLLTSVGEPMVPPPDVTLAIDALLGIGLNRAPDAALGAAIAALQGCEAPLLAIDLPSGLLADTGQPAGTRALRADHTLSLLTLKPGLFTGEGRAHAGRIWFDDLGVARSNEPASLQLLGPSARPARRATAHKGHGGQVLVAGGAPGMQGAARLAARAALASGAGRVYVDLLGAPAGEPADPDWPELMRGTAARLPDAVLIFGCGGGDAAAPVAPALLAHAGHLVLDADALNAVAAAPPLVALLRQRPAGKTLLTPHPLEAARLLGTDVAAVQRDRVAAARQLADALNATVVLKGSGSVIASPGLPTAICASGGPALATAGTGDVLAGWLGGLWAQQPQRDAHAIACQGVEQHGRAGEGPALTRADALVARLAAL